MFKPLKIRKNAEKTFFVSDCHFNHDKPFLYEKRSGYKNIFEHDNDLVRKWNDIVPKDGLVFNLGDFILGEKSRFNIDSFFKVLNFETMFLSCGNHYAGWKQRYTEQLEEQFGRTDINVYPLEYRIDENKTVIFMPNYYDLVLNGQSIVMSHYALACWNGAGAGSWMVCGHSHGTYANSLPDAQEGKIVDVGIEVFDGPISAIKLQEVMNKKETKSNDHHGGHTQNPF